jgi:transcriptional regulator with XRE-family HTH domain
LKQAEKQIELVIIGRRIKQLREGHHLSTRELGDLVGVRESSISRYENGIREPGLLIAKRIADYFGVTVEYLSGDDINTDTETVINLYSKLSNESKSDTVKYITYLYEKER